MFFYKGFLGVRCSVALLSGLTCSEISDLCVGSRRQRESEDNVNREPREGREGREGGMNQGRKLAADLNDVFMPFSGLFGI